MQETTITLPSEQINFLLQVLGDLPTKTGAFLVLSNLQNQLQVKSQTEQEVKSEVKAKAKATDK